MHIHEFQAKDILSKYSIKSPRFGVCSCLDEAIEIQKKLKFNKACIKAQIHAGGRGKMGAVKFAENPTQILQYVENLIGTRFSNDQTGKNGLVTNRVTINETVEIEKEYYISIALDKEKKQNVLICSFHGGVDVEDNCELDDSGYLKVPITLNGTFSLFDHLKIAKLFSWKKKLLRDGFNFINNLIKAYIDCDALLVEVNPMALTKQNEFLALDAKMTLDESAFFRHNDFKLLFDPTQLTQNEVQAKKNHLSFVPLEGDIALMVNGAGLAMATVDLITYFGGKPANFLDLGGRVSEDEIIEGLIILLNQRRVSSLFINIFAGIADCEMVAKAILKVLSQPDIVKKQIPIVIRLEGRNRDRALHMLLETQLLVTVCNDLARGVKLAIIKAGILN
jgi:succinyl-CoA synthetase beta subunit